MFGCYESNVGKKTPNSVFNKNQALKDIHRRLIYLTDYDHDYILEKLNIKTQSHMREK